MRNPEKYRLQKQRIPPSACECLKLFLEIATEDKLLAESGADRDANPEQDFQRSLWQISLDGSGGGAGAGPDPLFLRYDSFPILGLRQEQQERAQRDELERPPPPSFQRLFSLQASVQSAL